MSHSVVVTVALNINSELKSLEALQKEVDSCAGIYKEHLVSEVQELNKEINKAKTFMKELEGIQVEQEKLVKYQRKMLQLLKRVANIRSSVNYGKVYENISQKSEQAINKVISEHGIMAMFAIEDLVEQKKEVNKKSIIQKIEQTRQKDVEETKMSEIADAIQIRLISSNLPEEAKSYFVELFASSKTRQELMDINAYIETKIKEFLSMENLKNSIIESLEKIGFVYKNTTYSVTDEGEIVAHVKAFKDRTKDFVINLKTNRQMDWQFGNYENHLCDADGELFLENISKIGIKTSEQVITRNVSNSRPLRKTKQMKVKEK